MKKEKERKEKESKELEEDIELDDYGYENIDDEHDDELKDDAEEIDYDKFITPNDFDVAAYQYEDDEDEDEDDLTTSVVHKKHTKKSSSYSDDIYVTHPTLMMILKWFGFLGIIIALALIAYHITKGNFYGLFIYILVLIGSYFLGYYLTAAIDNSRK